MLTVGLTGNYGMGKSTVLGMFGRLGAVTVRADGLVDKLLGDASVLERMRGVLGETVFSGDGSLISDSILQPFVFNSLACPK